MRGVVRATRAGYLLIETEMGDFTVAEVMDGSVDLHDEVAGDLESTGEATLTLDEVGAERETYVQETGCSKAVAAPAEPMTRPAESPVRTTALGEQRFGEQPGGGAP